MLGDVAAAVLDAHDGATPDTVDDVIDADEQARRRRTMERVCLSCHGEAWVRGHFERYEKSHETTNAATFTATAILQEIWARGHAKGPAEGGSPFDEAIEHRWADVWLFYANSIRFTAAMAGAVLAATPLFAAGLIADMVVGGVFHILAGAPVFGAAAVRSIVVLVAAVASLGAVVSATLTFLQATVERFAMCGAI